MFGLPVNVWVAIVLGVVGVGWTFRAWIPGLFSGATALLARKPSAAKPDREAALLAFNHFMTFLEESKCQEGVEYFKAGMQHLYHSHAEQPR